MWGHDGIDRAIKVCFAAFAPVRLLMKPLIDGCAWTSLSRSRCLLRDSFTFIYISICQTGDRDYAGIVILWPFRDSCECIAGYMSST